MKSHATAARLVGAVLLSAAGAVAQTPKMSGRAMNGTLIEAAVPSTNVPAPVPITYYLPKNYDANRAERYPLIIQLHGGDRSNKAMENFSTGTGSLTFTKTIGIVRVSRWRAVVGAVAVVRMMSGCKRTNSCASALI